MPFMHLAVNMTLTSMTPKTIYDDEQVARSHCDCQCGSGKSPLS